MHAFLRDTTCFPGTHLVRHNSDGQMCPRRLRFDGMRTHGKDPARSFKNFNKSLLFYLNVCDFGSGNILELLYASYYNYNEREAGEHSAFKVIVLGN
jgi:hypothetical protein